MVHEIDQQLEEKKITNKKAETGSLSAAFLRVAIKGHQNSNERFRMAETSATPRGGREALEWRKLRWHLLAGALARGTAASVLFPLDTVKARLQFQTSIASTLDTRGVATRRIYTGMWDAFAWIAREEGFTAFFRGLPMRLIYITPSAAVSFALYEQFKRLLHNYNLADDGNDEDQTHRRGTLPLGKYEPAIWLVAGASARLIGTAVRTPFDIVKQRMQVQGSLHKPLYTNSFQALQAVLSKEGFRGLWQGYVCTMMRDVPFAGIYFSTYESVKYAQRRYINASSSNDPTALPFTVQDPPQQPVWHHLCAGALAGAFASIFTLPMDVVKLKIQTQNTLPPEQRTFTSIPQTYKLIYSSEGLRGFFRGWVPVLFKVTPAASITFAAYETYKSWFSAYDSE